jgi:hypothetical protein
VAAIMLTLKHARSKIDEFDNNPFLSKSSLELAVWGADPEEICRQYLL